VTKKKENYLLIVGVQLFPMAELAAAGGGALPASKPTRTLELFAGTQSFTHAVRRAESA
jgi:hypothetical protein